MTGTLISRIGAALRGSKIDEAAVRRVHAHVSSFEFSPIANLPKAGIELFVRRSWPRTDLTSVITVGLSAFALRNVETQELWRQELSISLLSDVDPLLAGKILERISEHMIGERRALEQHDILIVDSHRIYPAVPDRFSRILVHWPIWYPVTFVRGPHLMSDAKFAFVEVALITEREADLAESNFEMFQYLTMDGKIDLLDFERR